jgi:hypothetical protein
VPHLREVSVNETDDVEADHAQCERCLSKLFLSHATCLRVEDGELVRRIAADHADECTVLLRAALEARLTLM